MKIARRIISFALVLCAPAVLLAGREKQKPAVSTNYLAFVGTYTTKTDSKGINVFSFDASTGKMTQAHLAAESLDPSFVVVHPNGKYLYAVNEAGKNSMVSAFAINAADGNLTLLNQLPALGEDPCYISFDHTGKFVLIANYTSGNIAVFPVLADGKLGEHTAVVKDDGDLGPNKERQEAPHAHWIEASAGNRFAYVSDLGLDRVLIYKFDSSSGTLMAGEKATPTAKTGSASAKDPFSATLAPGTGPRHVAFSASGDFMYVLGELNSTVTVFANDGRDAFRSVQTISALPAGFSGRNDAAEIAVHPSGKFLYTSNRGNESIAVFAIRKGKGTLTLVANVPTGGKEPRHFAIDPTGRYLLAENQFSNNIVEFRIDPSSGNLTPTGEVISAPSPVCIQFLPAH
jgi:6-phosphogluconolactonase